MHGDGLRYALLGPVKVVNAKVPNGVEETILLTPQQRAVLVMLVARRGRVVTVHDLVNGVWGHRPPGRARSILQSQIFELRRKLEPGRPPRAPARVLVSAADGYRLLTARGACDTDRFDQAVHDAGRAELAGDLEGARRLLCAALSSWRGEPLAGVPGPYAESLRGTLTERRLAAVETRIRLALELGAHAETVPELTPLIAEHPLREGLRALQMLALYRGGRQAEALTAYTDCRSALAAELGVEPGAQLNDLYERVLRADPSLTLRPTSSPAVSGRPPACSASPGDEEPHVPTADVARYQHPTPAQLPAPAADFTARAAEVERLTAVLDPGSPHAVVAALSGPGGVGKTALALYAGHRVRDRYPDGQLHADLGGTAAEPVSPAEVLARFLRALGVTPVPDGLDERIARYRSALAGRRVLVLLDDAAHERQIAPLLPRAPGCAALVTSRERPAPASAYAYELEVFSTEEALALLSRLAGRRRIVTEPEAAAELVALCGHLPGALRVAGARLAQHPTWTVTDLVERAAEARYGPGHGRAGGASGVAGFGPGHGDVDGPSGEAAFRPDRDRPTPEPVPVFHLAAPATGPAPAAHRPRSRPAGTNARPRLRPNGAL
ncbi:BTAD domain-containing putative transcriptional regulator [Streptomyces sp. NPDC059070]|uniref:AfsR/SARP family transcriptional regulator n=1 Tax=Streptomyces sp. NPDC059070 TaxID=3346713 RepID=UPI0036A273F4